MKNIPAESSMSAVSTGQEVIPSPPSEQQTQTIPSTQLYDIYGPMDLGQASPLWWYIVGIAILCTLIGGALFFVRRKKNHKTTPCWQQTLLHLEKIQHLRDKNSIEYMDQLSGIVRHYIENRFGLCSTRQTTFEFFHSTRWRQLPEREFFEQNLRHCLEQADMAKFASMHLTAEQLVQMEEGVRHFVLQTTPQTEQKKIQRGTV